MTPSRAALVGAEESTAPRLDVQLAELIELVWASEAVTRREARLEAAVKYRRG